MTPTTARYRLETLFNEKLNNTPGNEVPVRKAQMEADIQCTIEIVDALRGLAGAANDMANRSVTVMNNLIGKIDEATKQSAESAKESGKVATESAKLARKLNSLTHWIVAAAILSALAAGTQALVALYNAFHPQQIVVQVAAPSSQTAPAKKQ